MVHSERLKKTQKQVNKYILYVSTGLLVLKVFCHTNIDFYIYVIFMLLIRNITVTFMTPVQYGTGVYQYHIVLEPGQLSQDPNLLSSSFQQRPNKPEGRILTPSFHMK